jgi:hypothetical protein
MKSKFIIFLAVLAVVTVGGIRSLRAQTDHIETADIPFDFYAGTQQMAAGNYMIKIDLENGMILLSDNSGRHTTFLLGAPAGGPDEKAELLFAHSGNTYALMEVKSDVTDLTFSTKVPGQAMESRLASSPVIVALNR